jgi:hypothetical protein
LLKDTFSSYSAKSFSKALSKVHDLTENEISGLNVWEYERWGRAIDKKNKNNSGSHRSPFFLSICL